MRFSIFKCIECTLPRCVHCNGARKCLDKLFERLSFYLLCPVSENCRFFFVSTVGDWFSSKRMKTEKNKRNFFRSTVQKMKMKSHRLCWNHCVPFVRGRELKNNYRSIIKGKRCLALNYKLVFQVYTKWWLRTMENQKIDFLFSKFCCNRIQYLLFVRFPQR